MTKYNLAKLHLRNWWLQFTDRMRDFANMAFPIFVVVGVILGAAKFWMWVFGL